MKWNSFLYTFYIFCNIFSFSSPLSVSSSPKFYLYELPEVYWWRWPKSTADCNSQGYLSHEHAINSGIGPPINLDDGLFLTWHFSLFSSLYNRMKRSSRRTSNPEEASMFIVPYDFALDGFVGHDNCNNRRRCTPGMADALMKNLSSSKYFRRFNGADHVFLWSLGQYHPWPYNNCDVLMGAFCARCTFTCYWMDPTKADNKFISVPFPSGYHWHNGIKNLPWDLSLSSQRNLTAVYLGSTKTLNPYHTKIRRAMTAQCNASTECHWMQIGHSSIDNKIPDFLSVYKRSKFCLCPPGDDPARKAVFDAIISGCIPVIFEVATLYNQYPWHIGEQTALDVSVSIPGGQVKNGKLDFMSVLLTISPEVIRKKQEALALLAPRVQYAMPPVELLQDRFDATTWDPPFEDGVEITLNGLFERTGHMVRNESTGIPHRLLSGREWSKEYEVVRVQTPVGFGNISYDELQSKWKPRLQTSLPPQKVDSVVQKTVQLLSSDKPSVSLAVPKAEGNSSIGTRQTFRNHSKLFYIYDLPEKFWWRWPSATADCEKHGYLSNYHAVNSGIGPVVNADNGLFLTWHFSLFSSLYNRMKRSSRRTLDPEKASMFIIPYDMALDGSVDSNNCANRRRCSHNLAHELTDILSKSKYFTRYSGADHVLLWSLGQYHPWPYNGCDVFIRDFCALCTFTSYWMDATKANNKFISVPFPSGYHWHDGIKNLPWDLSNSSQRNLTAVYLGSTKTLNPYHTKIRRAMTAQCNASTECHWMQIGHSSIDSNIADYLSVYKRSKFCLCPPGDDPARKAVFDAIISGCIPVIFEVATLYNQYPWHIGEQTALDVSVSIPGGQVKNGKLDFMSVLLAISPEVIRKKQEALALLAPRVQYAMPPVELLQDRFDATTWDPPFEDGVEITLNGLFERTGHMVRNESTGIPHRLISGKQWGEEYDIVRVKIPTFKLNSSTLGFEDKSMSVEEADRLSNIQKLQDKEIKENVKGVEHQRAGKDRHHKGGVGKAGKSHNKFSNNKGDGTGKRTGEKLGGRHNHENFHLGPGEQDHTDSAAPNE